MRQILSSPRLKPRVLHSWVAATLLATLSCASLEAQGSGIVGHNEIVLNTAPGEVNPFATNMTSDTVFVIPFSMYSSASGTYTLNSLNLDLRVGVEVSGEPPSGSGGPGGSGPPGGGGPSGEISTPFSGLSLHVLSTLPTSLTLPAPLVSFSHATPAAGPTLTPMAYTFQANSTPTFTAGATYYLTVSYSGPSSATMEWGKTTADSYGYAYPGDLPITSIVPLGTPLVYYKITSGGVQNFYDNVGGFSITANDLTAIPEPAASATAAAGAILAAILWVRRRRHRA